MTTNNLKDIKASVQQQFGQVAENYRHSTFHASGADLEALVHAADLHGNELILDAGTGTGHTALALAPHAANVIAVDLTEAMLEQGRQSAAERGITNVDFRLGDVEALPFENASFDMIVSRVSAHHWPHPQKALHEFARLLRPGGQVLLDDCIAPDAPMHDTFLNTIELIRDPSHVRDHSIQQWIAMFAEAGFSAQAISSWELPLDFDNWVTRMATPPNSVSLLKALFDGAPHEVRDAMYIQPGDYTFTINIVLFQARLR